MPIFSDSFLDLSKTLSQSEPHALHEAKKRPLPSREFPKHPRSKSLGDASLNDTLKKTVQAKLREEKEGATVPGVPAQAFTANLSLDAAALQGIAEVATSSDWSLLLDKLSATLVHMQQEGVHTTTLFLEGDPFSTSLFAGSCVTITEYSTAPKLFNVHFSASPAAVQLLQAHAGELVAAFSKEKFGFAIHRVETELLNEEKARYLVPPTPSNQQEF